MWCGGKVDLKLLLVPTASDCFLLIEKRGATEVALLEEEMQLIFICVTLFQLGDMETVVMSENFSIELTCSKKEGTRSPAANHLLNTGSFLGLPIVQKKPQNQKKTPQKTPNTIFKSITQVFKNPASQILQQVTSVVKKLLILFRTPKPYWKTNTDIFKAGKSQI